MLPRLLRLVARAAEGSVRDSLSLLIGIWLLNRVLRDIRQLNDAAIRIGRGEAPPLLNIERNDELGQLARSFHEMGHNLRTDALTGSFNREYLFNRLRSLRNVGETQVSVSQRFALLFVDSLAARGIDVDDVDAVFNYEVPEENEYYIHRIGRTGRAKKHGVADRKSVV